MSDVTREVLHKCLDRLIAGWNANQFKTGRDGFPYMAEEIRMLRSLIESKPDEGE